MGVTAPALASDRPRVAIEVVGCDPAMARESQRIAAIELRAILVESDPAARSTPGGAATRVTATCRSTEVVIDVADPITGKSLERVVSLAEAPPNTRARLLALAIAELIAASWLELERNPEPQAVPAASLAPAADREAARAVMVSRAPELAAVADVRLLASGDMLFGGGPRAAFWLSQVFFLQLDVLVDYGALGRSTGVVRVVMPSASAELGAAIATSTTLGLAISAGARGGSIWMKGIPAGNAAVGSHQQGAWLGPELAVQMSVWPRAPVHPVLAIGVGAHLVGVRGTVNGGPDVEAVGFWGALSAGAAVR